MAIEFRSFKSTQLDELVEWVNDQVSNGASLEYVKIDSFTTQHTAVWWVVVAVNTLPDDYLQAVERFQEDIGSDIYDRVRRGDFSLD